MKVYSLVNAWICVTYLHREQKPLPQALGGFSLDFSGSTFRTKVDLLQTTLRTTKYAGTDGRAYGACQWSSINSETNMYALVFTPQQHQKTQGLVRVTLVARHSVDTFSRLLQTTAKLRLLNLDTCRQLC